MARSRKTAPLDDAAPDPLQESVDLTIFDTIDDAWVYLAQARAVPRQDRQALLLRWIDLVAQKNPLEQDGLVQSGKETWGYRLETVRGQLKDRFSKKDGTRVATTVIGDDWMAEMYYRAGADTPAGFLVYDEKSKTVREEASVVVGKTTFFPPGSALIERGTILLPSGVEEYTDDYALFKELGAFINEYLIMNDRPFHVMTCAYILMSWVYERFDALPYLRVIGDTGTGKSRFLQTVGSLVYRPSMIAGATTASPIFRIIERFRGSLIMDEMDFGNNSELWDDMNKILCVGYQRGFPVLRTERDTDGFDIKAYDVFGPKILATRRRFKDAALESRCFSHTMPLLDLRDTTTTPFSLNDAFRAKALALRNKLVLWRFRTHRSVMVDPTARTGLVAEPRINQIAQPILACTNHPRIRRMVEAMMVKYSQAAQTERRESQEGRVAAALIYQWAKAGTKPERVSLRLIVEALRIQDDDAKFWNGYRVGEIMRGPFGLPTYSRGGQSFIATPPEVIQLLSTRYGIPLNSMNGNAPGEGAVN